MLFPVYVQGRLSSGTLSGPAPQAVFNTVFPGNLVRLSYQALSLQPAYLWVPLCGRWADRERVELFKLRGAGEAFGGCLHPLGLSFLFPI